MLWIILSLNDKQSLTYFLLSLRLSVVLEVKESSIQSIERSEKLLICKI